MGEAEEELVMVPTRYDISKDELVEVTQEWVNEMQALLMSLGQARRAAREAMAIQDGIVVMTHPALQAFLDAWKPPLTNRT